MKKNLCLHLAFWTGLTSLVYEIFSVKVLFLYFPETIHAVSITLSSFLAGLAFSSLFFSRRIRPDRTNIRKVLSFMQIALIAYVFLFLRKYYIWVPQILDALSSWVPSAPAVQAFLRIAFVWFYLFIPAFFIGGSFPILAGLFLRNVKQGVQDTGLVYFWDTCGAIVGALLAGFWLVPHIGLAHALWFPLLINSGIVFVLLWSWPKRIGFLLFLAAGCAFLFLESHLSESQRKVWLPYEPRFGNILFQEPSPFGVVTVGEQTLHFKGSKSLFVNYRDMCNSAQHVSEERLGRLVGAHLPKAAHALNIGLGCGFTAAAVTDAATLARLDIAEINPIIVEAAERFFQNETAHVLTKPSTHLRVADGAAFIRQTDERYDAIIVDIEEVSIVYSSPLYTADYFRIFKEHLKPDGVLGFWAIGNGVEFGKILYNSLKSEFPYVYINKNANQHQFYASDRALDIPFSGPAEEKAVSEILSHPLTEINTLENRALEKRYNIAEVFRLPEPSFDEFISEHSKFK